MADKNKRKAAVLFSGGKDSALALFKAEGKYDICCLLNMMPETNDSFMFHKPNLQLLERQAEMLGKELIIRGTKGEKEKELDDLIELLKEVKKEKKIEVVIIGGIKSNYQGERIGKICKKIGLEVYAPLWSYDADKLWQELLENKFKVIITKIASEGIPKEMLGKIIDADLLNELKEKSKKYGFSIDFEGGDAETSVLFMPEMKKEIKLKTEIRSEGDYRHFLEIKNLE